MKKANQKHIETENELKKELAENEKLKRVVLELEETIEYMKHRMAEYKSAEQSQKVLP